MPGAFLVNFFQFLLMALWALVFGRMIMSWVDPMGRNRASAFLYQTTEPILAPVRRMSLSSSYPLFWESLSRTSPRDNVYAQEEARARFQTKAVPLLGAAVAYIALHFRHR